MASKKYYVVWEGNKTGVFDSWDECSQHIKGYPAAKYKSFKSKDAALEAYKGFSGDYIGKTDTSSELSKEELKKIGKPILNSISVDGACSSSSGEMEYQGVNSKTKEVIFRKGPYKDGTNNVGEFLALVHALALCKQQNSNATIYSDSRTAMAWVRNKKAKSTMKPTKYNKELFDLIERAETWLRNNTYPNQILKWETKAWGEIPADFGRK